MGWLKDYFWDDKPCLWIRKTVIDDDNPNQGTIRLMQNDQEAKLIAENKELRKQLKMKKINAIDVDYKLLE